MLQLRVSNIYNRSNNLKKYFCKLIANSFAFFLTNDQSFLSHSLPCTSVTQSTDLCPFKRIEIVCCRPPQRPLFLWVYRQMHNNHRRLQTTIVFYRLQERRKDAAGSCTVKDSRQLLGKLAECKEKENEKRLRTQRKALWMDVLWLNRRESQSNWLEDNFCTEGR